MIKMKVHTRINIDGLKRLQKQLKSTYIEVGYIDSPNHWMSDVPVAQVASNLHYWSPWKDTFMLTDSKKHQLQKIITTELQNFGFISFNAVMRNIGEGAKDQIAANIQNVTSPRNSDEWASVKGFNDPLVFGSKTGEAPNLISALTFKVGV